MSLHVVVHECTDSVAKQLRSLSLRVVEDGVHESMSLLLLIAFFFVGACDRRFRQRR